jgi:MFS family permease
VRTNVWSRRVAPAVAVAFGLVTLAVGLASVPLDDMAHQPGPKGPVNFAFIAAIMVPAVAVGTLLAARRPRNPIGWLLLAIFLLAVAPAGDYAIIDYRMHHGTLPLGSVAVVLSISFPLWLVLIAIMLWVFPDGRLPAGRWRPVAVILVTAGLLLAVAATAAGAAVAAGHAVIIDASGNLANKTTGLTAALQGLSAIGALVSLLTWLAVQVPRYRRASYERRQQLKWLYTGAGIFVVSLFLAVFTPGGSSTWDLAVNDAISPIGFAVLPVCVGVAVLKYQLYAINRIISRVISYAMVSVVLAGVFAGLVLLTSEVLPFRTPVAVAMATLAAAALFNPLRRQVQRTVDRRFNRSRYDAEAVIAEFTVRLRGTVDLNAVRDDLTGVVHQAFEPAHVSVWLPRGAIR